MPIASRHLRSVPDQPDQADRLLGLVAVGDRDAYAALFELVAPTVLGLCRRVVRDPDMAEEITQEVMLEVWRKAPSHRADPGAARTWIAVMAHRRAVDRVRSEQSERDRRDRHAQATSTGPASSAGAGDPVVEAVTERSERRHVQDALESLTPLQRQTVELAYYGGHTHTEVATLLDVPVGTVKTRIRDGLIRLRDTLHGEEDR